MLKMLDYRAHKLYWLLWRPFRLFTWIIYFGVLLVAIWIAEATSYSKPIKIVIAYACFEAGLLIVHLSWWLVWWSFAKVFFWLIDVVPAHGADVEAGRAIVLQGRTYELNKKLETDIGNWTEADTHELISRSNKWPRSFFLSFFPVKARLEHSIREFKRIHQETGKQLRDIGVVEIEKIRGALPYAKISWLEKQLGRPGFLPSLSALALITAVIGLANGPVPIVSGFANKLEAGTNATMAPIVDSFETAGDARPTHRELPRQRDQKQKEQLCQEVRSRSESDLLSMDERLKYQALWNEHCK